MYVASSSPGKDGKGVGGRTGKEGGRGRGENEGEGRGEGPEGKGRKRGQYSYLIHVITDYLCINVTNSSTAPQRLQLQLSQLSLSFCLLKLTDAPDDSLLEHGGDLPRIVLCTVRASVYFHAERILITDENKEINKQSNKLYYYLSRPAIR